MSLVATHTINGVTYFHKLDHRDGTSIKSQWGIDESEERGCFKQGHSSVVVPKYNNRNKAMLYNRCWGLHIEAGQVKYLGKTADKEDTFIAIFNDSTNKMWHGYPADRAKNENVPPAEVLKTWLDKKYLKPTQVRKIAGQQICRL